METGERERVRVHSDRGGYPVLQHGPRDVNDVGIFCITLTMVLFCSVIFADGACFHVDMACERVVCVVTSLLC